MDSFLTRDYRKDCKYGETCYQKNPEHKSKFKHPEKSVAVGQKPAQENKENKENSKQSPPKKRPISEDTKEDDKVDGVNDDKKIKLHTMSSSDDSQEEDNDDSQDKESEEETCEGSSDKKEEVFEDLLPDSPTDVKDDLKLKYLVTLPEDFFIFFDFCKSLNTADPLTALSPAGLKLCGPYDVLGKNIPDTAPRSEKLYLTHGR